MGARRPRDGAGILFSPAGCQARRIAGGNPVRHSERAPPPQGPAIPPVPLVPLVPPPPPPPPLVACRSPLIGEHPCVRRALSRCRVVCRHWKLLATHDSLWAPLCSLHFGLADGTPPPSLLGHATASADCRRRAEQLDHCAQMVWREWEHTRCALGVSPWTAMHGKLAPTLLRVAKCAPGLVRACCPCALPPQLPMRSGTPKDRLMGIRHNLIGNLPF